MTDLRKKTVRFVTIRGSERKEVECSRAKLLAFSRNKLTQQELRSVNISLKLVRVGTMS